jgi:hypothetical protein
MNEMMFKKSMAIDYEKSHRGTIIVKATSEIVDLQGDIVKADGYDIDYLLSSNPKTNLEHIKSVQVGKIVGAEYIKSATPYVTNEIELDKSKKGDITRGLIEDGFIKNVSIEFKAYVKDMIMDGTHRVIKKSFPNGIAFTCSPANLDAIILQKSQPDAVIRTLRHYRKAVSQEAFDTLFPFASEILYLADEMDIIKSQFGDTNKIAINEDKLAENIAARLKLKL